ncbi:unnamed protein product [Rotaria magnacalcarata]|uniref:Uncharacterized protein n=2 Tax=Rotaria magnacalcarata TaxID=392030 RepID=A0A816WZV7_9BILA|nr:unnamed protein product [Rotaria magnacalcarata]CAF1422187.1 unnamed protein product [Rotaria magnacalcarata]CAF2140724.1 unnamed protein product [Rotaria magnacalcarata]CAF3800707.1 unnamed protein product [Rotaria magnacalcarata]CAF3993730.1 unnamed protein product [Rotaria magnacalcarata]
MQKLLIVITFICFSLATAGPMLSGKYPQSGGEHLPSGGGEHFPSSGAGHFPSGGDTNNWASKLCANSSLAQAFLSKSQAVITQLNSNGSFAQFLQQKAQEVAYIQNSANVALLSSNCTQYFNGLTTAQKADMETERQQREYENIGTHLLQQIIPTIFGYGSEHH